jgi:serine/threonine protein kinase/WD40 repeat protein
MREVPNLGQLTTASWVAATDPEEEGRAEGADFEPAVWHPGDIIQGLYEVKETLGEGGMGVVHRVYHRGWDLDLAVKSPRPWFVSIEQDQSAFERECETWISLAPHPNVVSCYYVRRLGGTPRIFAELVSGGSLRDWTRGREGSRGELYSGPPEVALERILDVAIQFAWGLQHAHEHGLIHQDVKPANVLMTPDGTPKVTDFGLARVRTGIGIPAAAGTGYSALVSVGGMTPAYCSPEQVSRLPLSRGTDIWSWAVSVLEMFAAGVTWPSGDLAPRALEDHQAAGPRHDWLPRMPPELVQLLRLCFHREPARRPRNASEIAQALRSIYSSSVGREYRRLTPRPGITPADTLNNRALSLLDLGKPEEAKRLWNEALRVVPNHPEATYNLGLVQWRTGAQSEQAAQAEYKSCLQVLSDVVRTHPGYWLPLYLKAQVEAEQGEWQSTLDTLRQVAEGDAGRKEVVSLTSLARERALRGVQRSGPDVERRQVVNSGSMGTDGRYALAGRRQALALWEIATGRRLRTFEGHTGSVGCVHLGAGGKFVLSGGEGLLIEITDIDDPRLVGCTERVWVDSDCVIYHERNKPMPPGMGLFSEEGADCGLLGIYEDLTVRLWDVDTGNCVRTFEGHTGPVNSACLTPDGRFVVSGSGFYTESSRSPGEVIVWDVRTGQSRTLVTTNDAIMSVSLSGDGRYLLVGSCGQPYLQLWDFETGRCVRTYEASEVHSACLSSDACFALVGGPRLGVALYETASGRRRCWFPKNPREHAQFRCEVHSLCMSGDGRLALSASYDGGFRILDIASGGYVRNPHFRGGQGGSTACLTWDGRYALRVEGTELLVYTLGDVVAPYRLCRPGPRQDGQEPTGNRPVG